MLAVDRLGEAKANLLVFNLGGDEFGVQNARGNLSKAHELVEAVGSACGKNVTQVLDSIDQAMERTQAMGPGQGPSQDRISLAINSISHAKRDLLRLMGARL